MKKKNRDQQKHDDDLAAFATYEQGYRSALRDMLSYHTATEDNKTIHYECRETEGKKYDTWNHCYNTEMPPLRNVFAGASGHMDDKAKDVGLAARKQDCAPQPAIDWSQSNATSQDWDNYRNAVRAAIAARNAFKMKEEECNNHSAARIAQSAICDEAQDDYENAACAYRSQRMSAFDAYDTQYREASELFQSNVQNWNETMGDRTKHCEIIYLLQCYVDALINTNVTAQTESAINICDGEQSQYASQNCTDMRFTLGTVPDRGSPAQLPPICELVDEWDWGGNVTTLVNAGKIALDSCEICTNDGGEEIEVPVQRTPHGNVSMGSLPEDAEFEAQGYVLGGRGACRSWEENKEAGHGEFHYRRINKREGSPPIHSAADCAQFCASNANCHLVSYNAQTNECFLDDGNFQHVVRDDPTWWSCYVTESAYAYRGDPQEIILR